MILRPLPPWLVPYWQQLSTAHQQQRLPHALLLSGNLGMGKTQLAQHLAAALLCMQPTPTGESCGQCQACHLLRAGNHPDFSQLMPLEKSTQILIDQVRGLIQFCSLTANYGRYQVAIIEPAEAMNVNAANSLLKLLEEPPDNTLLMLISHHPMQLLPTIRSRCQRLDLNRTDPQVIRTWLTEQLGTGHDIELLLTLSANAPLAAIQLAQQDGLNQRQNLFSTLADLSSGKLDPIKTAAQWAQQEVGQVLYWLISWMMDVIRFAQTQQNQHILNQDQQTAIQQLAQRLPLIQAFEFLDLLTEHYRLAQGTVALKPNSLLEPITLAWVALTAPMRKTA